MSGSETRRTRRRRRGQVDAPAAPEENPRSGGSVIVDAVPQKTLKPSQQQNSQEYTEPKGGRNLKAATLVGVVALGVFGGTLLFYPPLFGMLAAAVLVGALIEFRHALRDTGKHLAMPVMVVGAIGIFTCAWKLGLEAMLAAALFTAAVALLWHLFGAASGEALLRDVTVSVLAIAYLPFLGSFLALMVVECGGPATAVFILAVTLGSDTGGYVFGRLLGKHKMTPRISPKKTWEGILGSILFAVIICTAGTFWIGIPWWIGPILGVLIAVLGTIGDLSESLLKRELGLKDMGHLLPGHGGLLDRLDSILMSVPVAYLVLRYAIHFADVPVLS